MESWKPKIYVDQKLRLPLEERDRRWKRIRLEMALRHIDCLVVMSQEGDRYSGPIANLSYLTGIRERGYCLFPMEQEPIAFVGTQNKFEPYNYYTAIQNWISEIRSADSTLKGGGIRGVIECIKAMGFEKGRLGLVDGNEKPESCFPYKHYLQLMAAFPQAKFTDETAILTSARLIKSPLEIELLAKAGQLARASVDAMIRTCRVGMRESDVYNAMMGAQIDGGGDPHSFILLSGGPVNEVSHLFHGKFPPYSPSQRRFEKGDLVVTEFHSAYGGYLSAAEFSVAIGSAEPGLKHLHSIAVECFKKGTAAMQVGTPFNQVIEAFRGPVLRENMRWLELGVHAHGLTSGGFPSNVYPKDREKDMIIRRGDGTLANISSFELEPGMVFGHNIDINNPAWRPNVGVQLGDTVVITEKGPRLLSDIPLELPIND